MSTTITTTPAGYYLTDPRSRRTITFASILQAVSYCRENGLIYTLAL
jgi:hypothetical protein